MRIAITRQVSPAINNCELTHLERLPIDLERAIAQHGQYEAALRKLGVQVISLPAEPDLPDSVFVEDVALVVDECALLLNPGAPSRRPEVATMERALAPYRELFHILPPGTLDGGDILRLGRKIYIGLSGRSNGEAVGQVKAILEPHGYQVHVVNVSGCLHLKSAVTQVRPNTLLVNPEWVDEDNFPGMQCIRVDPSEPYAGNTVLVGDTILYPSAFPKTQKKLEQAGVPMLIVDADEIAKAEGALTCCSLIFDQV